MSCHKSYPTTKNLKSKIEIEAVNKDIENKINYLQTIIFVTFWDFVILYWIILSSKIIVSNKDGL